jgi:ryanodine receptor 2
MAGYVPNPIETSNLTLTDPQKRLVERLAANAHEVWAKKRMDDGWQYGHLRNDDTKTHPCLVPYDQLPESEKDYDRTMVEQMIKAAIALGFRIEER